MYEVVVTFTDGSSDRILGVNRAPFNKDDEYVVYDGNNTAHYFPKRHVKKMTYGLPKPPFPGGK